MIDFRPRMAESINYRLNYQCPPFVQTGLARNAWTKRFEELQECNQISRFFCNKLVMNSKKFLLETLDIMVVCVFMSFKVCVDGLEYFFR